MCTSSLEQHQKESSKSAGNVQFQEIPIQRGGETTADDDPSSSRSLGERIQSGSSLLTLTNLMTAEEIDHLKESALECADAKTRDENNQQENTEHRLARYLNGELDNEGVKNRLVIRMPIVSSAKRHDCLHDALPESLTTLLEEIMERTLEHVDHALCPSIHQTLFSADDPESEENANGVSIADLFRNHELVYSTREPAVNVYHAPHGHFGLHRDDRALTILIPLSHPDDDFTGGGTAFWSEAFPQPGRHDPSLVLRPPAGTAVLFGGQVQHAGLHIRSGTRVVFVASFSRRSQVNEDSEE